MNYRTITERDRAIAARLRELRDQGHRFAIGNQGIREIPYDANGPRVAGDEVQGLILRQNYEDDPAYVSLMRKLTETQIGEPFEGQRPFNARYFDAAGKDRRIVADALFAEREEGVIPTLVTSDIILAKRLFFIGRHEINVDSLLSRPAVLRERMKDGFVIEVEGRKLRILPFFH